MRPRTRIGGGVDCQHDVLKSQEAFTTGLVAVSWTILQTIVVCHLDQQPF